MQTVIFHLALGIEQNELRRFTIIALVMHDQRIYT